MDSKLITLSLTEDDARLVLLAVQFRHVAYFELARKPEPRLNHLFCRKYAQLSDRIKNQMTAQGGTSHETLQR